jgi:hypothetical protein
MSLRGINQVVKLATGNAAQTVLLFTDRDYGGAGTAGVLSEQPLLAVQIDEPGVRRIHPHPPLRFDAVLPSGSATAGLVDPQHPHRFRLDQPRFGVFDEGAVRGRPRHSMRGSDLRYRPGRIPDRTRSGHASGKWSAPAAPPRVSTR